MRDGPHDEATDIDRRQIHARGGGSAGERPRLGQHYVGGIPGYALDPHGRPEPNAIYYKTLAPGA